MRKRRIKKAFDRSLDLAPDTNGVFVLRSRRVHVRQRGVNLRAESEDRSIDLSWWTGLSLLSRLAPRNSSILIIPCPHATATAATGQNSRTPIRAFEVKFVRGRNQPC
jgi:hypothetical protein